MEVFSNQTIQELSKRCRAYRISYPMTQKELADRSGVSVRSIQMFEQGKDIQLSNFIKIVDALDLGDHFSVLIPDVSKRPSMYVDNTNAKQRVRKKRNNVTETFQWGDE